jgi:hypothetical protein
MRKLLVVLVILLVVVIGGILIWNSIESKWPKPGTLKDEALAAGRTAESMPGADEDYYADMDYGLTKNPEAMRLALDPYVNGISAADAVKRVAIGRNNWIVWTAGNDRLWDILTVNSLGNLDLVKTLSNHPVLGYSRDNRWSYLGLVNEPCFKKGTGPRADRYGLWLDVRDANCPPDPFENEQKYPGVKTGARGVDGFPVGSYYGYGTGIIGLRLFPNPAFDQAARDRWDPVRYYEDPSYFNDPKLVKPYRVGMSCGFCHVGPNPSRPPADFENPKWENLNSNPGAQYFWIERIFKFNQDQGDFIWQLFHTSHPGALDTSLVSSDQINNPRTMNAIYNLKARLEIGRRWGQEQLAGGSVNNKQFNNYVPPITQGSLLTQLADPPNLVRTTHVLKDGSDAVGALGALNRVYVNIGLFSEEWLTHFQPLIGGTPIKGISPIPIATAEKNSTYWNANTNQTPDLALFFLATAKPDYLAEAPGGQAVLAAGAGNLQRGKEVFAERCARCHSSKFSERVFQTYFQPGCIGPNYLKCWNDYWQHTKTQQFKDEMKTIVNDPTFLVDNFLSNEVRVPSTLMETNACSPLATNALRGNIWDNFSSESYKNLPSVGKIMVHHPYTGAPYEITAPGGGRGFTRPASLISLWSTAPFFQNNRLGPFDYRGTVEGRLASFDKSIEQLLWPERREGARQFSTKSGKAHPGIIDGTTKTSYLMIPPGYVPPELKPLTGWFDQWIPDSMGGGDIRIGPIPAGTPVNLITNINIGDTPLPKLLWLGLKIKNDLKELGPDATDEEAKKVFAPLVKDLLAVSKCPDFIVNRGHYFGTDYLPASEGEPGLSDEDKHALIAFLKTF